MVLKLLRLEATFRNHASQGRTNQALPGKGPFA